MDDIVYKETKLTVRQNSNNKYIAILAGTECPAVWGVADTEQEAIHNLREKLKYRIDLAVSNINRLDVELLDRENDNGS